jgi:hypothetical protein
MMNPTEKLLSLQRKAEQLKSDRDKAKGRLESLYDNLSKLGCSSLEEAKMDDLDSKIEKKERLLEKEVRKLEADYEW